MMKQLRFFTVFTFLLLCSYPFFSETEGERLFKINDPSGAVPLLEKDIASGNISSDTYNFLGLAYFQLGDYKKALDAFEREANLGNILEYGERRTKRPLNLSALADGPRMRLLWASFQRIEEEASTVSIALF